MADQPATSATSLAEPPTIARKTKAQKQREYRQRIAASRTPAQVMAARKLDAERQRICRLRKAANSSFVSGPLEPTTASPSRSETRSTEYPTRSQRQLKHRQRRTPSAEHAQTVQPGTSDRIEVQQAQSTWNTRWASSVTRFKSTFLDNDYGCAFERGAFRGWARNLNVATDETLHQMQRRSKVSKDHLTDINIKEEVSDDNEINDRQVHIEPEYTQSPITNKHVEYQINDANILGIKQELPCDFSDFEDIQNTTKEDYDKLPLRHMRLRSKAAKDQLTDIKIKEEVSEDIQVNDKQLRIKSEYTQSPITDEHMEHRINDAHILGIKQELPCAFSDFDNKQNTTKENYLKIASRRTEQQNRNSGDNLIHINIKEEPNKDQEENEGIQESALERLQIKSAYTLSPNRERRENQTMKQHKVDNDIYPTGGNVANENGESKLLVPEIKVSNVYDHVLEINPLKCANFDDDESGAEEDDSETESHHIEQRNKTSGDNLVHIIKEETCYQEGNEDIPEHALERLQIKATYTLSPNRDVRTMKDNKLDIESNTTDGNVVSENGESQLLVPKIKISNVFGRVLEINPLKSANFKDNQSALEQDDTNIESHNEISGDNLTHVNIKEEACYQEQDEDVHESALESLQIESAFTQSPIRDEQTEYQTMEDNDGDVENYPTGGNVANENGESKLLVPEIKVSNVYDHVLEINPLKCANFNDNQTVPEHDDFPPPPKLATRRRKVKGKTAAERSKAYRARQKALKDAAAQDPNFTPKVPEKPKKKSPPDNIQEPDVEKSDNLQTDTQSACPNEVSKKRKSPAEYSREYRARKKALMLWEERFKPKAPAVVNTVKRKTAAERSREYRARKKASRYLKEPIPIAQPIEMVVLNNPCAEEQDSILPEFDDSDTAKRDETTEGSEDAESGDEESESASEAIVNNIYDHILDIKQEDPSEFSSVEDQNLDSNPIL